MTKLKRRLLILALGLVCMLGCGGWTLSAVEASAATNTGDTGIWQSGQTVDLIPELTTGLLTDQGWTLDNPDQINLYGWGGDTGGNGVAIRARDTSDDIGNSNYSGGVYYTVTLSAADRVKANLGQLRVSASSRNYHQSSATHHMSVRVQFLNADGQQIGAEARATYGAYSVGGHSGRLVELAATSVPAGTASMRVWFSNWGSLSGRPYIADMQCYLYDTTAPSYTGAYLEETSTADSTNHIVVTGDTIKYFVAFNEKVSVISAGTATITLNDNTFATSAAAETVMQNGVASVGYTFRIPSGNASGTVALSSVSGLVVADEAGNTYTYSGSPTVQALTYYCDMRVSDVLSDLTISGAETATYGIDYTATLLADSGISLPSSITVTVGNVALASGIDYQYNSSTGGITIYGTAITGDIVITAAGAPNSYVVTLDQQGGTGGAASVQATYDAPMPQVTPPTRTGYTFGGYFTESNGAGTQYYGADGASVRNCDLVRPTTLYAKWTANEYTVTLDHRGGSGTNRVQATYDAAMPSVTPPTRTGYTFSGYYAGTGGTGTCYYDENGNSVNNYNIADAATLYAHWIANTYTINYDANKPASASGNVTGSTSASSHTYDQSAALTANGFALTGWTFAGWATSAGGSVEYENRESVINLAAEQGAAVTLYAVWTANSYDIVYHANQPAGASASVSGSMSASGHTYDAESALTANAYALTGWTFTGWATSAGGAVVYTDGASVRNLSEGTAVDLYAVWERNSYTVEYDPNKPASASGIVTGSTSASSHTYDQSAALTANGFALTGWTFAGWATSADGSVAYANGASVTNLTADDDATVTLYAVWKADEHELIFNASGGSGSGTQQAVYDSALPSLATLPVRNGYKFAGYFSEQNGAGDMYYDADGAPVAGKTFTAQGNITLYAYWEPVHYTIHLYSMGECVGELSDVTYGVLELPSAEQLGLERQNYDFVGWNLYDEQNWSMYSAEVVYSVGLTGEDGAVVPVYAAWQEKNIYTINYDANGGAGAPAIDQAHEDETVSLSLEVPVRENYTFLGWAASASAAQAEYQPGDAFTMGDGLVTLYAVWEHNPELSYNANGGHFTAPVGTAYPAAGERVNVTYTEPTRTGHLFLGWATSSDAQTAQYAPGEEFVMPDEDTVLYAVWQRMQYEITCSVVQGYTVRGLAGSYPYGETATFTVVGEAPKVYVNGTLVQADVNGAYSFLVEGDTVVVVADDSMKLLIYSANGGVDAPVDLNVYAQGEEASVLFGEPVRTGYVFLGWSTEEDATQVQYVGGDRVTVGGADVVLYAVWQANTYTVVYHGGGAGGSMASDTITYDSYQALSANAFEMEGYTFVGWAVSENGEVVYGDGEEIFNLSAVDGAQIDLYAVWEATVTDVTFDLGGGYGGTQHVFVAYGEELSAEGLLAPERRGYIFGGYFTMEAGEGDCVFDGNMNVAEAYFGAWTVNEEVFLVYAYWIPVTYTVVYIDGQTSLLEQAAVYGNALTLKTAEELGIVVPEGKSFIGWSARPDSQTADYADGQTISASLSAEEGGTVYLYAVWINGDPVSEQIDQIRDLIGSLDAAIEALEKEGSDLAAHLKGLAQRVSEAEQALDGLDDIYATDEQLADEVRKLNDAITQAKNALVVQLNKLDGRLGTAEKELAQAIADIVTNETDIEDKVSKLNEALDNFRNTYDTAMETVNTTLTELLDADAAFLESISSLEGSLKSAEKILNESIERVKADLEREVSRLEGLISGNDSDIEDIRESIEQLGKVYVTADSLLRQEFEEADAVLKQSIADLQSGLDQADSNLQSLIEQLRKELESMASELNAAISANEADIEDKVSSLNDAYRAADALINSDIAALKDVNEAFSLEIIALENAYQAADEALWQAVRVLQERVDALESGMEGLQSALNNKADTSYFVWPLIVLLCISVVALATAVVGIFLARRAKKQ